MIQHLCIKLIKKLLRMFFFQDFKNHLNNQSTILKRANTQFQLEDYISAMEDTQITTMHKFKAITKSRLLFLENEITFF